MVPLVYMIMGPHHLLSRIQYGIFLRSVDIFEGEPIWLNVSITLNQFKYIITGLSFTDIMPPYFKENVFESIQMISVWKYNTKDFSSRTC